MVQHVNYSSINLLKNYSAKGPNNTAVNKDTMEGTGLNSVQPGFRARLCSLTQWCLWCRQWCYSRLTLDWAGVNSCWLLGGSGCSGGPYRLLTILAPAPEPLHSRSLTLFSALPNAAPSHPAWAGTRQSSHCRHGLLTLRCDLQHI